MVWVPLYPAWCCPMPALPTAGLETVSRGCAQGLLQQSRGSAATQHVTASLYSPVPELQRRRLIIAGIMPLVPLQSLCAPTL